MASYRIPLLRGPGAVSFGCPSPWVSESPDNGPYLPSCPLSPAVLGEPFKCSCMPATSCTCGQATSPGLWGQPEADRTGARVCGD